ncbi:MAG: hypothetical protein ABFD82_01505 [Syntrophaceae bacterium]
MNYRKYLFCIIVGFIMFCFTVLEVWAVDSESTRQTLKKIQGVMVITEELQPNLTKYVKKNIPSKDVLQMAVELRLKKAGVKVLTYDEWMKSPGRPILYVNINTHEHEKYWFVYNVSLDLQQVVFLESNPKSRALASTWSINVTGITNIGSLGAIQYNILYLVDQFIGAYKLVNGK